MLRKKYNVDTVLLVLNNEVKDPTNKESNLNLASYGLYHNDWLGTSTFIHLFARLLLVDTRSAQVVDEAALSEFAKVDNNLWHEGLAQASAKDRQTIKQETKAIIKSGVLHGLLETNLVSRDSLQESKEEMAAGGAYREAVGELYKIFGMGRLFTSYARGYVDQQLNHNSGSEIYADIYRRWVRAYFGRMQVVPVLHEIYQSRNYALDELQSFVVLAKNSRTRQGINQRQLIQPAARQAWEQLAASARLDSLVRAVERRRNLIRREVNRARQQ